MSNLFDSYGQGYYGASGMRQDTYVAPKTAKARQAERVIAPACETKDLEMNPLWFCSGLTVTVRAAIQICGSFMMVLTSLLIMVSYDVGVSPMASSFAVAVPYFLVVSMCPSYHFNPILTFICGLIPMTPCDIAPDPSAETSVGQSSTSDGAKFVKAVARSLYDIFWQATGSVIAAVLVWDVMNMSGTDIISRFDAQVRDDIAKDAHGRMKVFWYVFIFNCMFGVIYFGIRYSGAKTTCKSVQAVLSPTKIFIVSVAYFIFTTALAPIIGVGGLNLIVSLGPATATLVAPVFYLQVILGQIVGFGLPAAVFRFVVHRTLHTCGCSNETLHDPLLPNIQLTPKTKHRHS